MQKKKILNTFVPIVVKISPDINKHEIENICEILVKYDVSAIIISNTTDRNRENLKNINKLEKGSYQANH